MKIQHLSLSLLSSQMIWPMVIGTYWYPPQQSGNLRIIGGEEAESGNFPYAVSFQCLATDCPELEPYKLPDGNVPFCGGSLISRDVVLTAA